MADWTRNEETVEGDIEELAKSRAEELESAFSDEQLETLTKAKGLTQLDS